MAVALGAFGAHRLEGILTPEQLGTWDMASRYLMAHAIAALVAGFAGYQRHAMGFLLAAALFSGSLYVYLMSGFRPLVFVTPIGGLAMVASWLWLANSIWNKRTG